MNFKLVFIPIVLILTTGHVVAKDLNLHEELSPKIDNENVEVRTYKNGGQDGGQVTEYRSGGKVWMIKVQPAGDFPPYYLYDDAGDGTFKKRIAGNEQPSPPMWIIKRF